jgi:hypothetical protein
MAAGVIMTELGRHIEKTLNPVLKLTLKATLMWAFKSIPQVQCCAALPVVLFALVVALT